MGRRSKSILLLKHHPKLRIAPGHPPHLRKKHSIVSFCHVKVFSDEGVEHGDRGGWAGEVLGVLGVLEADTKVRQDVHIGHVGLVGAVVGVEVLVHIAVGEEFGAHVIEVVAGLEAEPIPQEVRMFVGRELLYEGF